jgi:mRNA-degrading endonuclease RelE of RelBE toxin-antitoxin system
LAHAETGSQIRNKEKKEKFLHKKLHHTAFTSMIPPMFQIVFNKISAAEISQMPTLEQLEVLSGFQFPPEDLEKIDEQKFGIIKSKGRKLYRHRMGDYRIYFAVENNQIVVYRVLHANSLKDFFFRTKLGSEDDVLGKSKHFWKLIDEGQKAGQ